MYITYVALPKVDPERTDVAIGAGSMGGTNNSWRSRKSLTLDLSERSAHAAALEKQGDRIGRQTVAGLLDELGYSLQGYQKTKEGSGHPDRDAQFRYNHDQVENFQRRGQPVVSVDTKKKELVGDFKNAGKEFRKGQLFNENNPAYKQFMALAG